MSQIKKIMSSLFPRSFGLIAEKLDTPQFLELTEEATEIQNRLDAQTEGNVNLKKDYEAMKLEAEGLKTQVTEWEAKYEKLEKDFTASKIQLEAEKEELATKLDMLKPYEEYAERLKAAGRQLPVEDPTNPLLADRLASLPEGHPDRLRAENLKRRQAKAAKK